MEDDKPELTYEDVPQEGQREAEASVAYVAHPGVTQAVMSSQATLPPRIEQAHGGVIQPFNSATASAAAKRRWELKNEAVRRGIARAAKQIDSIGREDDLEMVSAIMENQALRAYDPSQVGSAASARLVLDHGYPEPRKGETAQDQRSADLDELVAAWRAHKASHPEAGEQAARLLSGEQGQDEG